MAFQCVVVTPESQLLDEKITQAIIPAHDGQMGILTDRAPLLAKLGIGPLRVDLQGGEQRTYLIDGGIAQMKDNTLTILTESAVAAEAITTDSANAEYAQVEARQTADETQAKQKQHDLQKARAKQTIAKR